MKYKVGNRVRIRKDLTVGHMYGGSIFTERMSTLSGEIVKITEAFTGFYRIDTPEYENFGWTDSMLEPITELTASEVIVFADYMCAMHDNHILCPVYKIMEKYNCSCFDVKLEHTDDFIDTVTKWVIGDTGKKKEIETECCGYAIIKDSDGHVVYEERIKHCDSCSGILKRYCEEHDGNYYAVKERRAVVKERVDSLCVIIYIRAHGVGRHFNICRLICVRNRTDFMKAI